MRIVFTFDIISVFDADRILHKISYHHYHWYCWWIMNCLYYPNMVCIFSLHSTPETLIFGRSCYDLISNSNITFMTLKYNYNKNKTNDAHKIHYLDLIKTCIKITITLNIFHSNLIKNTLYEFTKLHYNINIIFQSIKI